MVIATVSSKTIFWTRVGQVGYGLTRSLTGLKSVALRAGTKMNTLSDPTLQIGTGVDCSVNVHPDMLEALHEQGIDNLTINSHLGERKAPTEDLERAIVLGTRMAMAQLKVPTTVQLPLSDLSVIVTSDGATGITTVDIYRTNDDQYQSLVKPANKDEMAREILTHLPRKNYLSPNTWRSLLANMVMADENKIAKYSALTDKFLELEHGSYSFTTKAVTLAAFFNQAFAPADRNWLLTLGSIAARYTPRLFYLLFSQAVKQAARLFIAGENVDQAIKAMEGLAEDRVGYILDFVAEEAGNDQEAQKNIFHYMEAIRRLITSEPPVVSVKLTGLVANFSARIAQGGDEATAARREAVAALTSILRIAKREDTVVIIDLERFSVKDPTLDILEATIRESNYAFASYLGVVEQTYLQTSLQDTARLATFAQECSTATAGQSQLFIRFVKGAYQNADSEFVLESHEAVNQRYIECLKLAYSQFGAIRLAIASHNLRTISEALELARTMGVNEEKLEFEMLLGMPASPLLYALAQMGRTCRFYMPVGTFFESIGYFVRRMVENANSSSCQKHFREFAAGKIPLKEYLARVF